MRQGSGGFFTGWSAVKGCGGDALEGRSGGSGGFAKVVTNAATGGRKSGWEALSGGSKRAGGPSVVQPVHDSRWGKCPTKTDGDQTCVT